MQLLDARGCDIALGHVAGPDMVDQAFRELTRQYEFAFRYRDEGVAQPVEPEPGAAFICEFAIEPYNVSHVSGPVPGGGKHAAIVLRRRFSAIREAPLEDGGEQWDDRKLQRLPGLNLLDPEDAPPHVHLLPAQGYDLALAHAGVDADQENGANRQAI